METNVPMKAARNSCEHGLGEVAGRVPGHERAVAGLGRGSGKGEERTSDSQIHPGSDGGIGTKPVDMSKDDHMLKPLRIPDDVRDIAVTGGDIDGDEQGAGVTSRCGIPSRAAHGQPGEVCKNWKHRRAKSRPHIDRLGQSDARSREGNQKAYENYATVNEQPPLPPQALHDVATTPLAGIAMCDLILLGGASRRCNEFSGPRQNGVKTTAKSTRQKAGGAGEPTANARFGFASIAGGEFGRKISPGKAPAEPAHSAARVAEPQVIR